MAERRMFAKTIIDSDAFLDLSITAQLLYFHLSMRADDEGFVNKPKAIMAMVGAKVDDMKTLCDRKFVIAFDSGVVVIKHWMIHNFIRRDTFHETKYKFERACLYLDENKAYSVNPQDVRNEPVTNPLRICNETDTQVRLGKDRLGKDSNKEPASRFKAPTVDDVKAYCIESGHNIDADRFVDFYESKAWYVGKNKMKDWKAAVRNWSRMSHEKSIPARKKESYITNDVTTDDIDDLIARFSEDI